MRKWPAGWLCSILVINLSRSALMPVCLHVRPRLSPQVAYLVMLGAGLWIYWTNLFVLLPNPWVDAMHV